MKHRFLYLNYNSIRYQLIFFLIFEVNRQSFLSVYICEAWFLIEINSKLMHALFLSSNFNNHEKIGHL